MEKIELSLCAFTIIDLVFGANLQLFCESPKCGQKT